MYDDGLFQNVNIKAKKEDNKNGLAKDVVQNRKEPLFRKKTVTLSPTRQYNCQAILAFFVTIAEHFE